LDSGHSALQVHDAVQTIEREKQRRRASLEKSNLQDKADVVAEMVKRKLERAVGKRGRSNDLYKKWMVTQ